MAGVTALRDAARAAIFAAGGRGFVRFAAGDGALLVSDAARRGDAQAIVRSLESAGFMAVLHDGLLAITPGEALLLQLCAQQPGAISVDWESPLLEAMTLADRFLREERQPLEESGREMILAAARLLWQPQKKVLAGLPALRARAAAMLRTGKRSGLHETGRLLCGWLHENQPKGGRGDEA